MIFDRTTTFSDAQAITATGAVTSTDTIDLGATGTPFGATLPILRDIGKAGMTPCNFSVTEAFNNLTSITVSLQTDDNTGFTSPATIATGAAVPLAQLVAGYQFAFPAELYEGINERYVRAVYTVAGTAPTTGRITGGVVMARQTNFVGGRS
jgi:hypothetical protein